MLAGTVKVFLRSDASREIASERGNSIIEFLLCFPFVFVVFVSTVDLGRALNTYFTITRVVYEGARFAGQVGGLEVAAITSASTAVGNPGHQRVRSRVDILLQKYGMDPGVIGVQDPNYLYTERLQPAGDRDQVRVRLRIPFQPIFPLLQGFLGILGTEATGPYLFMGNPTPP